VQEKNNDTKTKTLFMKILFLFKNKNNNKLYCLLLQLRPAKFLNN
jgi:hypothetical protein